MNILFLELLALISYKQILISRIGFCFYFMFLLLTAKLKLLTKLGFLMCVGTPIVQRQKEFSKIGRSTFARLLPYIRSKDGP